MEGSAAASHREGRIFQSWPNYTGGSNVRIATVGCQGLSLVLGLKSEKPKPHFDLLDAIPGLKLADAVQSYRYRSRVGLGLAYGAATGLPFPVAAQATVAIIVLAAVQATIPNMVNTLRSPLLYSIRYARGGCPLTRAA